MTKEENIELSFPAQLDVVKNSVLRQIELLKSVAGVYADAIGNGGMVHVYANGHSRVAIEEMAVRMGALTGFHPLLSVGLTSFTDVIGSDGLRMCQFFEKVEGSGKQLLGEVDFGRHDALLVITATGTTTAAVDIALEFSRQYPDLPLIALASAGQSQEAPPKHSSGLNLWHVVKQAKKGYFIDNGMPIGDLTVEIKGKTGNYRVCPLSSIGALAVVQSLNELTIKELDSRGIAHPVLRNMHLANTSDNYDLWLRDQRKRFAQATYNPDAIKPLQSTNL